jgi:exonuclease III
MDSLDKQPKQWNMGMRFGSWNIGSSYRVGSQMAVSSELSRYRLDLVGVQEVRWEGSSTAPAGEYRFYHGKGNENHELGTGVFVHKGIISAVKRVEFVSDRMSYIILRGHWFHIIFLNVHVPTEDKTDNVKDSFYEELESIFNNFPKCHKKMLVGDFNAKVGKEDIFKPTIENDNLREISNDTWTSSDGKTHNQIDHSLIDRGRHSSVLDVHSFRVADFGLNHYLVVVKIRERLAGSKQGLHKVHMERFNLK